MRKLNIHLAEVRDGIIRCPSCDAATEQYVDPGYYECENCTAELEITQTLKDFAQQQNNKDDNSELEDLKKRVKRLEKELGIK
jgi:hypothetical protein